MSKATVTSKGQVTIPHDIRKMAKIGKGTRLDFQLEKDGSLIVRPATKSLSELKGIAKVRKKRKTVSLSEMKKAIYSAAKEKLK